MSLIHAAADETLSRAKVLAAPPVVEWFEARHEVRCSHCGEVGSYLYPGAAAGVAMAHAREEHAPDEE